MSDWRGRYKLEAKPLGHGGYADVFPAVRRDDGQLCALKRLHTKHRAARLRLRREVDVQQRLHHPNVMPIWDADPMGTWLVMPRAVGNLDTLRDVIDEDELIALVAGVAAGLQYAHEQGHVHRDITPSNILALPDRRRRRWVVADWGLVTWSDQTGTRLTGSQEVLGTTGYIAPELADGAEGTAASDVYSLGKVVLHALTGANAATATYHLLDGDRQHWRGFVRACTEPTLDRRLPDMTTLRERLAQVVAPAVTETPATRARLVIRGLLGEPAADGTALYDLAADFPEDIDLYLDELARLPASHVRHWVSADAAGATQAACQMARHLIHGPWGDRDSQYLDTPLGFVHAVARGLAEAGALAELEDVVEDLLKADIHCARPTQRVRTLEWMAELDGRAAEVVVRVLAAAAPARSYYHPPVWWRPRHAALTAVLAAG